MLSLAGCRTEPGGRAAVGTLIIDRAVAPEPVDSSELTVFMRVRNDGPAPDALVAAEGPGDIAGQLHTLGGNPRRMMVVDRIDLPAASTVLLKPGGYHLMLDGLPPLRRGDTVLVTIHFETSGVVTVKVPVLQYTEAVNAVGE
jgi:copper(I)-binding protein